MLTFLRRIRRSLLESGRIRKYLLYAIGEIALVVIGILIALQINNWNEDRKSKNEFGQTMLSLAVDIRNDTTILQRHVWRLETQEKSAQLLIPILENRAIIRDSIAFYSAFREMSNAINMDLNTEIWDQLRRSGLAEAYADPQLVDKIQNYYYRYRRAANNWENEKEPRIEMRGLKYDLLNHTDLEKLRYSNASKIPSQRALEAVLNEERVRSLTKRIEYTSTLFIDLFSEIKMLAIDVLDMIDKQYPTDEVVQFRLMSSRD